VSYVKVLLGATEAEREAGKAELSAALERLEREALPQLSGAGPYFLGGEPSLVDFTFYPWFERLPALAQHTGFQPPALERLTQWREVLHARPSVRAIENPTSFYVERYRNYRRPAAAASESQTRAKAS
jgi:glutathione S-transferase